MIRWRDGGFVELVHDVIQKSGILVITIFAQLPAHIS
jgi:hypothetical protein